MVPTKLQCCQRAHREKKQTTLLHTPCPTELWSSSETCSRGVPLPRHSCSVLTINSCQFPKACLSPRHVWSCLVAGQAEGSAVLCQAACPQPDSYFLYEGALQYKESCLSRKLTSEFLWGSHAEGVHNPLQFSFPDSSWLLCTLCDMPAYTRDKQWPGRIPLQSQPLSDRAWKDTSGHLKTFFS